MLSNDVGPRTTKQFLHDISQYTTQITCSQWIIFMLPAVLESGNLTHRDFKKLPPLEMLLCSVRSLMSSYSLINFPLALAGTEQGFTSICTHILWVCDRILSLVLKCLKHKNYLIASAFKFSQTALKCKQNSLGFIFYWN